MPRGAAKSCWGVANPTKTKVLRLAADRLGGPRKLRDYLGASSADVAAWIAGVQEPPTDVMLRALAAILNDLDKGEGS